MRERPIDAVYSGLEGDSTSGSSGIVGGSGAVSGSCSGIVPGSVGMGSSGVGRSGVVPGSWLAISSLLWLGETYLPGPQPAKRVGLGLTAEQPRYDGAEQLAGRALAVIERSWHLDTETLPDPFQASDAAFARGFSLGLKTM